MPKQKKMWDNILTVIMTLLSLLWIYPIVLILLALFGKFFGNDRRVYCWTIGLTLLAALYDLLRTLPEGLRAGLHLDGALRAVGGVLPLSSQGLGWICPAALGLVIGLIAHFAGRRKAE